MKAINKMLCLVDGEHYLPVTQEAIDTLNNLVIFRKTWSSSQICKGQGHTI